MSKPGDRVRLLHIADCTELVKRGDEGIVAFVDDSGTVHVNWATCSLGLIPGRDRWETVRMNIINLIGHARWTGLSFAARGLAADIEDQMDDRGVLVLQGGLDGLAEQLGHAWEADVVERSIEELLAKKIVHLDDQNRLRFSPDEGNGDG